MNRYEVMLLMVPDLEKDKYSEIMDKVSKDIESHKGKLESWQIWGEGKRKLAYSIRSRGAYKKRYDEGIYILSYFRLEPDGLKRLKYLLSLEENVLRFLVIKKGESNG